jgi:hypothetical protein
VLSYAVFVHPVPSKGGGAYLIDSGRRAVLLLLLLAAGLFLFSRRAVFLASSRFLVAVICRGRDSVTTGCIVTGIRRGSRCLLLLLATPEL